MAQHNNYSNPSLRNSQITYENARDTSVPMQAVPMRAPYFEAQLGASRIASFEQDSRGMTYRDLDYGRHDSQRGDLLHQARQQRVVPVDGSTRYTQPEVMETAGQTWGHLSFNDPDLVDQFTNGQRAHVAPEHLVVEGSPKSNLGRPAPSLAQNRESTSDDNLSTATTAVESGSDDTLSLRMIATILGKIERNQVMLMKKMEAMDTATAIRLSDLREHMDKKFERIVSSTESAFDEIWEKLGSTNLEVKRVRDVVTGHDPRRTPPVDSGNQDNGAKRRRFEE